MLYNFKINNISLMKTCTLLIICIMIETVQLTIIMSNVYIYIVFKGCEISY